MNQQKKKIAQVKIRNGTIGSLASSPWPMAFGQPEFQSALTVRGTWIEAAPNIWKITHQLIACLIFVEVQQAKIAHFQRIKNK